MSSQHSRAGAGPLQGEGACDQGEPVGVGPPAPAGVWMWLGEGLGSDVVGLQEGGGGVSIRKGVSFQARSGSLGVQLLLIDGKPGLGGLGVSGPRGQATHRPPWLWGAQASGKPQEWAWKLRTHLTLPWGTAQIPPCQGLPSWALMWSMLLVWHWGSETPR